MQPVRIGDTIISANGKEYCVESVSTHKAVARNVNLPQQVKTFEDENLECIDFEEGLWQEMA